MSKLVYILMFIFTPIPSIILGFWVSYWKWTEIMKALIISDYILCFVLLVCVRIVGGPERNTRKEI